MKGGLVIIAIAIAVGTAGCATQAPASCHDGTHAAEKYELYFGRNRPDGSTVSNDDWQAFANAEVSPRFASGYSVIDAAGEWRDDNGKIIHEPSKILIVIGHDAADNTKLADIRNVYKQRYQQQSVLLVQSPVCASF